MFSQIGFWSGVYGVPNIFYLGSSLSALFYFFEGYLLKNYTDWLTESKIDRYILIVVILGVCLLITCGGEVNYHANLSGIPMWRYYLCGMLGPLAILALSKFIDHLRVVSFIGRNSIVVLCIHFIILKIITPKAIELPIGYPCIFLLLFSSSLFFSIIVIPILKKYAPWAIARQDLIKY